MVAAACSPLGVFDTVAPWDAGASRIAQSLPYGPLPRQSLDVYVPKPKPASAPVLIFFYGGAWSSGSKEEYGFVGAAFAAQGFVTIVPDCRLFPEVQFPDFLRDSAQAVRWAQQNATTYGGNPRHVVLVGHSAGAYNAIMLGLDQRFLEAAGVDATAIRAVAGLAGPYDFLPLDDPATINTFGRAVDLAATQPVNFAQANSHRFSLPRAKTTTGCAHDTRRHLRVGCKAWEPRSRRSFTRPWPCRHPPSLVQTAASKRAGSGRCI
jgi:acetyl esterase/lipase